MEERPTSLDTSSAPEAAAEQGKRQTRWPLIFLCALLLCALLWMVAETRRLNGLLAEANGLLAQAAYAEGLDAYARLRDDDHLPYLPFARVYRAAGEEGMGLCADALAEMERAAEAERLLQEAQAAQAAAEAAEAQRKQGLLAAAIQAHREGRREEAIELVKASGLQPELAEAWEEEHQQMATEGTAVRALAALEELDLMGAMALAEGLSDPAAREELAQRIEAAWAEKLPVLQARYENTLYAGAWYSLVLGAEPQLTGDRRYEGLSARFQPGDTVMGGVFSWMRIADGQVELIGDTLGAAKTVEPIRDAVGGALGLNHGLILHADGAVTHFGAGQYGRGDAASWTGITAVAAGAFHSLGLKKDGTVAAAGLDLDGQCQVGAWKNVVAIAAGLRHSVALTRDGRVLAAGDDSFGQCRVAGWRNVVAVRCGGNFTLGLTADGRLLAAGDNGCGQCDVGDWTHVVAFDGGIWHTVALLQDGRVVATGANDHGQCALQGLRLFETGMDDPLPERTAETATEISYVGDAQDGPWLYVGSDGAAIAAYDADKPQLKVTRADLICTYGHPPVGILSGGGDKVGDRVRPAKLARQNDAVFAITGDYFTFRRSRSGLQIRRGRVIREKQKERGFSFFPDGSLGLVDPTVTTAEDLFALSIEDSWVFGPVLIENGVAQNIRRHPLASNGERTTRTVMASFGPYHHLGATYGGFITMAETLDDLVAWGCDVAYNLDGGRSSMMTFLGEPITRTPYVSGGWRNLRDMVGFLTSDLVPDP